MTHLHVHASVGASGHFRVLVGKPGGAPRVDTGWFDNLILDAGLDRMRTNSDYLNSVQVGTGNSTPTAGQTQLDARIAGRNATNTATGNSGSVPYYSWKRSTYAFAIGEVVGNVSELGIGRSATTLATLYSRALIEVGGVPTAITVGADESLTVIYELRIYPQAADSVVEVVATGGVDSTPRNWTCRALASNVDSTGVGWRAGSALLVVAASSSGLYTGSLGTVTATAPGGTALGTATTSSTATSGTGAGSFTTTWAAGAGTGTVKSWRALSELGAWQIEADVPYDKTASRRLVLTLNVTVSRRA
jgi:hypothetical protein